MLEHRLKDRRTETCCSIPAFQSGESEGVVAPGRERWVTSYGSVSESVTGQLARVQERVQKPDRRFASRESCVVEQGQKSCKTGSTGTGTRDADVLSIEDNGKVSSVEADVGVGSSLLVEGQKALLGVVDLAQEALNGFLLLIRRSAEIITKSSTAATTVSTEGSNI